jgi:predicted enzyme related to lactoylglutathione lyase
MEIKDKGHMATLTDPTGAFFGLWQPNGHNGFEVVNEAGAPSNWYYSPGAEDVDKTVQLVKENGGTVIRDAEDTPYGRLAAVADPTGAGFNLSSLDQ